MEVGTGYSFRLKEFLAKRKAEKGENYTHTIIGGYGYPGGSYSVSLEDRAELYQLIAKIVFVEKGAVSLTEKPSENSVVRIDIDLKYTGTSARQYTVDNVKQIVACYNETFRQYLQVENESLMAYVMEREEPYTDPKNKDKVKDGIHIMYPNLVLSKKYQTIMRIMVLPQLRKKMADLLQQHNLDIDDVIDKAVLNNNWLLYGCSKPNVKPYLLTMVLDEQCQDILPQVDSEPARLVELLKVNLPETVIPSGICAIYESLFEHFDTGKTNKKPAPVEAVAEIRPTFEEGGFKDVTELVDLLSTERADNYQDWMNVGFCLRNISAGLLHLWVAFSQKSLKYEEGQCDAKWHSMAGSGLGIGSLHRWAKMDNPEGYKEKQLEMRNLRNLIKKASSCSHQDIAQAVHELYSNEYVSTDGARKGNVIWYHFSHHRWKECNGKVRLQEIMQKNLQNDCRKVIEHINKWALNTSDDEYKDKLDSDVNEISKLVLKLKDANFKDKVFSECIYMFYDENFGNKLDENTNLIGCENGVFDLKNNLFRAGQPNDYITLSTGIEYFTKDEHGYYTDKHPHIQAVNGFFNQIQPHERMAAYLKILLGGCLYGRNIDEKFYLMVGVGGNGKSKLIEFFETTLGAYASSIASNYFTQKRPPSQAANPDFAKVVHARIVTAQETEEGEKFNIALLKSLVGNDKITYRELYGRCREVRPKFNILMAVNHLPTLPADDEGTWRRIRVITFMARFCDSPDPNNQYEHKKDRLLSSKFVEWRHAFLFLLFCWHQEFRQGKLVEPPEVLQATEAYQKQNDRYAEFFTRNVAKRNGSFVTLETLYTLLKEWWTQNVPCCKCPDRKGFKDMVDRRWGKAHEDHEYGSIWRDRELIINNEIVNDEQICYVDGDEGPVPS